MPSRYILGFSHETSWREDWHVSQAAHYKIGILKFRSLITADKRIECNSFDLFYQLEIQWVILIFSSLSSEMNHSESAYKLSYCNANIKPGEERTENTTHIRKSLLFWGLWFLSWAHGFAVKSYLFWYMPAHCGGEAISESGHHANCSNGPCMYSRQFSLYWHISVFRHDTQRLAPELHCPMWSSLATRGDWALEILRSELRCTGSRCDRHTRFQRLGTRKRI